jgi:hypothetical protein
MYFFNRYIPAVIKFTHTYSPVWTEPRDKARREFHYYKKGREMTVLCGNSSENKCSPYS